MPDPKYIGSEYLEKPESGSRRLVTGGVEITRIYHGKKDVVLTHIPSRGQTISPDGIVTNYEFRPDDGGTADLTIVFFLEETNENGFVRLPRQTNPRVEFSYQQLEKPIEGHPTKGLVIGELPDYTELSRLQAWRDAPATRKQKWQYAKEGVIDPQLDNDPDWETLLDKTKLIAAKIARGQESYMVASPIVHRISVLLNEPVCDANGYVDTSTPEGTPPGFEYLKMPDTARQREDGSWDYEETWQGADEWDSDYYSAGA